MAIFLPRHNAIFIHVPKTGGIFIEQFLRAKTQVQWMGYRHSPIELLGNMIYDSRYFKFMFVREPSEWYRSYWQMKMGGVVNGKHWYFCEGGYILFHPTWEIDPDCGSPDINEFVKCCSLQGGFLNRMYKKFIGEGRIKVNYIGDTASLTNNLSEVFKHIGLKHNLEQLKKMPKLNSAKNRVEMTEEMKSTINEVEDYYYQIKKGFQ